MAAGSPHTDLWDYIVVGSGFGGSVAAMRLTEKGYRVLVLEEGKWWEEADYPRTNNNPFRFFWKPSLLCRGIQRIDFFRHTAVLSGAGVGGGSLVYANTLLVPPDRFFESPSLPGDRDWKQELAPHYETAAAMLGRTENPTLTTADDMMLATARAVGRADTFYREQVGVFFGEPDVTVPDPYFNGEGPDRTGCTLCAGCMTGCKVGAKNVLLKNYLYFALKNGARIEAEQKVVDIRKEDPDTFLVTARRPGPWGAWTRYRYRTRHVVLAAGVLGTLRILFQAKRKGQLNVSHRLGFQVRTNSESLLGVRRLDRKVNLAEGVAITSGVYIDEETHVEPVRYPEGSNIMAGITTLLTDAQTGRSRKVALLKNLLTHPVTALRALWPAGWARQSVILLVMQTSDNRIRLTATTSLLGRLKLKSELEPGAKPAPVYIPQANTFARKMAKLFDGIAMSNIYEVLFGSPLTAHILGGCPIGETAETGVVDHRHRLFGEPGILVTDGSVIPANLGVNPSLTITAMAERAMAFIPAKGKDRGPA